MANSESSDRGVLELALQLARTHRALSTALVRNTIGLQLSFGQVVVLLALARSGTVRQHELAKILSTTKSNVVQLIDGLMELNLIVREQDPSDRRANLITLTSAGQAAAKAINAPTDELTKRLSDRLGGQRMVEIVDWLREVDRAVVQPEEGASMGGKF
ncbi:MAG: MarR family transcriptional regulator [Phycisphaerales bacterium]|nr:MarR family transcriptional regulator [Phycisphaerales bacterium]